MPQGLLCALLTTRRTLVLERLKLVTTGLPAPAPATVVTKRIAYYGNVPILPTYILMQKLSDYSLSQLRTLEAQVEEELKKRHFLGISQAREQILHIARGAGISVDELLSGKPPKDSQRGPVPVKYRDPNEPTHQWSGRGRQPAWVKDWIASGKSIDETKV
jgi:DNA-binding protein H-NS